MDEHAASRQYWMNDAIHWEEKEIKITDQVVFIYNEIEQLSVRL